MKVYSLLSMKNLSLLFLNFLFISCATSPTGRNQLILVSNEQMNQIGEAAFNEMKTKIPRSQDLKMNQFVNCVVAPLTKIVGGKWEVVVFKEESVNAFALPGGKIGVHTGMFKAAKNDAQLAAVVGHEIGHVLAQHGAERVSQGLAAQGGLQIIEAFLLGKSKGKQSHQTIMAALGLGLQYGVILPHGRTQESEADLIGLDLMAKAGFDPRQSVELWKNMSAISGEKTPEWLSTHPSNESRISGLESKMAEAVAVYKKATSSGTSPHCD